MNSESSDDVAADVDEGDGDEDTLGVIDLQRIQSEPTSLISFHTPSTRGGGGVFLPRGLPHSMLTKALCEERGGWRHLCYGVSPNPGTLTM